MAQSSASYSVLVSFAREGVWTDMERATERRLICSFLLLGPVLLGLGWRMLPLGLSPLWFKYGGSALWAIALYWLIAICWPRCTAWKVAATAAVAAALLE